jgi:succinate dehydrogenase / fumarate reductase membrane anchor subunit
MVSYRTSLGRAKGLGAAKQGVGVWIAERVSSVALVPLSLWAVCSGLTLSRGGFAEAQGWMHSPLNAVLAALLTLTTFQHMHAGLRVVIEDYIHKSETKAVLLLLNLFACVLIGALALFCILKVALSAGGVA